MSLLYIYKVILKDTIMNTSITDGLKEKTNSSQNFT